MADPSSSSPARSKANITSPIKRRLPITQHRQGLSQQLDTMDAVSPASTFVTDHLRSPPRQLQTTIEAQIGNDVVNFTENDTQAFSYAIACVMLNEISECIRRHLKLKINDKLVFVDHHSSPLQHHPCPDTGAKPDIGTILEMHHRLVPKGIQFSKRRRKSVPQDVHNHKRYLRLPWHIFVSLGEIKPKRDSAGPSQIGAYAGLLNQARPDKPGVYCLSLSPRQYRILWSDPSGLYSSDNFQWVDLKPLISYVFSLYDPPPHHIKHDSTISLDTRRDIMLSPRWTVEFQGQTYTRCKVIFVGSPWTRQSWIVVSDDTDHVRIIKDQYQADGRRYDEGMLFDILQQDLPDNRAPGCVHVERHGAVVGVQTPVVATRRQRKRMVMSTLGASLYDCASVFDFLKVMYDALEAHRWLLNAKGVLHRDISINNILLPIEPVATPDIECPPKFINEILDPNNVRAPSTALLCDFDNGCIYLPPPSSDRPLSHNLNIALKMGEYDKEDGIKRTAAELKNRTGTPAFIARSVAQGEVLSLITPLPAMPKLSGTVKAAYLLGHSQDPLRAYEDSGNLCHGGTLLDWEELLEMEDAIGNPLKDRFIHQPCHDAESMFWVIVAFLLRALPVEDKEIAEEAEDNDGVRHLNEAVDDDGGVTGKNNERELLGDKDDTRHHEGKEGHGDNEGDNEEDDSGDEDDGEEEGDDDDEDNVEQTKHEEDNLKVVDQKLDAIWRLLAEHSIEDAGVDTRAGIFNLNTTAWKAALHPKLSFLASMLRSLCSQVHPEYSLVVPAPPEFHLHEAIQRILLSNIWSMKDSDHIALGPTLRPVTVRRYDVRVRTIHPLSFGSKRSRPHDEDLQTEQIKKSRR